MEGDDKKKAAILKLIQEESQSEPAPEPAGGGDVNVSGSNHIVASHGAHLTVIKTEKVITRTNPVTKPGIEHISEEQCFKIKGLVDEIIQLEKLVKRKPAGYAVVWPAVSRHCGVNAYRMIPYEKFGKAVKYLQSWIGRLRSADTARTIDPTQRTSRYAAIHARAKGQEDRLRAWMVKKYAVSSMTELSNDDLEALYRSVMRWKQL